MSTSALPPAADASPMADEPALTTEAALADPACADAIDAWWHGGGRFGRFEGNGGLSLACAAFVQADAAAERGAIVIVNGRTESLVKYPEVARDLWCHGYSVYLYDHRGQGLSDREPAVAADPERGHVGRFDDYVDDLASFVRTQVAPAGHRAHYLLAHSMGGAVAALWLETPGGAGQALFRAAALLSPMLAITGPGGLPLGGLIGRVARAAAAVGLATRPAGADGRYTAVPFDGNPFTHSAIRYARWRDAYQRVPQARLGAPTVGWLAATCESIERACQHADQIGVPLLLLVAGEDAVVHPSGVDAFCARLSRPAVRTTIDGARHELLIESDAARDRALHAVLRFFAGQQPHAGSQPPAGPDDGGPASALPAPTPG